MGRAKTADPIAIASVEMGSSSPAKKRKTDSVAQSTAQPGNPLGTNNLLHLAHRLLRPALTGMPSAPCQIEGLSVELDRLTTLLHATVVNGESNSLLVIGPRGTGKSMLVHTALARLAASPQAQGQGYVVLHLNGLAHSDDNVALLELARQLAVHGSAAAQRICDDEEQGADHGAGSAAGTAATAAAATATTTTTAAVVKRAAADAGTDVATRRGGSRKKQASEDAGAASSADVLLGNEGEQHDASLGDGGEGQNDLAAGEEKTGDAVEGDDGLLHADIRMGSVAAMVTQLLTDLKAGDQAASQSIIVVLDDFDLFAHPGKQSLLYSLFDLVQARCTPMALIGCTCRVDVQSLLEKRVFSRFSLRHIYLHGINDFAKYVDVLRRALTLPTHPDLPSGSEFVASWQNHLDEVLRNAQVLATLRSLFDLSRDVRQLLHLGLAALCRTTAQRPYLLPADFYDVGLQQHEDAKVNLLLGVSVLEICLLIATYQASLDSAVESANFETAYDYYKRFVMSPEMRERSIDFFSKPVAFKAFEHLLDLEVIRPVEGSRSRGPGEFRATRLMLEGSQINELLDKYSGLPKAVKIWGKQALDL